MINTRIAKLSRPAASIALLFATAGVLQGTAVASAPAPSVDLTCSAGGVTTASWRHLRVNNVQLIWYTDVATLAAKQIDASGHPTGHIDVSTPAAITAGVHVHADYYSDDGNQYLTTDCA